MTVRRLALFMAVALSACLPKPLTTVPGDPQWGVEITWHGHSCFTLKDSVGRTIVVDPFDDTVGYDEVRLKGDALLITHAHFDHADKRSVRARGRNIDLVESTGTVVAGGVEILGVESWHDPVAGQIHGTNRIYVFTLGGLRIAHFWDFGQRALLTWQIAQIGDIDILLLPVGGVSTINGERAKAVVDILKPEAVFPMHYGDIRFYKLDGVDAFLERFSSDQVKRIDGSTVRIHPRDLGSRPTIYVPEAAQRIR